MSFTYSAYKNNYPQYALNYPQYFLNNGIYDQQFFDNIILNWRDSFTLNTTIDQHGKESVLTNMAISPFLPLVDDITITTYLRVKATNPAVFLYDQYKRQIDFILDTTTKQINVDVLREEYPNAVYFRFRASMSGTYGLMKNAVRIKKYTPKKDYIDLVVEERL